jgi:hypothetical protein
MIRLIAAAGFAMSVVSAQAMTPAPIARPDGMITKVAYGCGAGQTLRDGQCVARTDIRQARRAARREAYGAGAPYYAGVVTPAAQVYTLGLGQPYYTEPHYSIYNHYFDVAGQPWYAVRAYYAGGPWYYGSNGWADYAARAGIGCTPGTLIKGGDNTMYVCQ